MEGDLFGEIFGDDSSHESDQTTKSDVPTKIDAHQLKHRKPALSSRIAQSVPIAADDIRRTYSKLLESALNKQTLLAIKTTISKIAIPNMKTTLIFPRGNPHGLSYLELNGVDVFADYFHNSMTSSPDVLFFSHDAQISGFEDGTSMLVSKFTLTGSRLFTITAHSDGQRLPDPPAVKVLHSSLQGVCVNDTSRKQQQLTSAATSSSSNGTSNTNSNADNKTTCVTQMTADNIPFVDIPLNFKTTNHGGETKYDSYKKQRTNNILGAYIDHQDFTENSLRHKNDRVLGVSTANSVSEVEKNDIHKSEFSENEVLVAGQNTKFGHGEMLPIPVKWSLNGVHKYYINQEHKIYKIYLLAAFNHK